MAHPIVSTIPVPVVLNQPWADFPRRDENDIPPECRLGQFAPDDSDEEVDSDFAMHDLYVRGHIRALQIS